LQGVVVIIQIAVGVFLGLVVFFFVYKYFSEKAEQSARINKEKQEKVKTYLSEFEGRLSAHFNILLDVFIKRLQTLEDDPSITYQEAGLIELRLLMEQCGKDVEFIQDEERPRIDSLYALSDDEKIHLKNEVTSLTNSKSNDLQLVSLKLFEEKVLEIANARVN
jgi:uncharacterized protein YneF (UPF0154 family)